MNTSEPSSNNLRIAIQGFSGAFHEIAANRFHGRDRVNIIPAHTFDELVDMVEKGEQADGGMMAIENTIAGSLLSNYILLNKSDLNITGEIFLRIRQNLMALPGQRIENLKEVHSHPIAIAQCRKFFKQYPQIKLISTEDTALSARRIREKGWEGIGAIASTLAADIYDMELLAEGIETNKTNFTRFLVLDKNENSSTEKAVDKVSLCFSVKHEVGSLHKVLEVLVLNKANMTKIQSVPLTGSKWQYVFFIDFVIEEGCDYHKTIMDLKSTTKNLKILGRYQKGLHYDS